jgi:hypothetical protein
MLGSELPADDQSIGHPAVVDGRAWQMRSPVMRRLIGLIRQLHERPMALRSPAPLRRFAIFDHVPKTGGTALNQALLEILTPERVAVNRHVDVAADNLDFADRYLIITGHFGGAWRRRLQRRGERLTFTVIRDPVDRAISLYNYWRHRIPNHAPEFSWPAVQAAKTLRFADFIRANDAGVKRSLFNTHYSQLAGGRSARKAYRPESQKRYLRRVKRLAAEFDVIGITERLSESLEWFLDAVGSPAPEDTRSLLAKVDKNASPRFDPAEMSSEDRAFVVERNQLDLALHAIAADRLDRSVLARS